MRQSTSWYQPVIPIALIFSFRMLGLFLLIPVFTIYANQLASATPLLVGLAFGIYGLTQALFQIPFGMLSDKLSRKPIIALGLVLFVIGSLLGAMSHSIYTMIIARALQGMGAVGSVLIALIADLTTDNNRTKAMAVIGLSIAVTFSLAMVISPLLTHWQGLSGIFYLTAALGCMGILMLFTLIPTPKKQPVHLDSHTNLELIASVLKNKTLVGLDFGIFSQHFVLTATFFVIPLILKKITALSMVDNSLYFYLPLVMLSFLMMVPFIILAEKYKKMRIIFLSSILVTGIMQLFLVISTDSLVQLTIVMTMYFIAFNILEATLPSLISRKAPIQSKGTAMGVYSTSQFFGIFLGGFTAGITYNHFAMPGVFVCNACICLVWLIISVRIDLQTSLKTMIMAYNPRLTDARLKKEITTLAGVHEAVFSEEEQTLYLKVNPDQFNEQDLSALTQKSRL